MASTYINHSQSEDSASFIAVTTPLVILMPLAVSLVWVQMAQVLRIEFAIVAFVSVVLFSIFFVSGIAASLGFFIRSKIKRDTTWLPLIILCFIFSILGFVLVRWDADDTHYLSNAVYFLAHPETRLGFEAYYIHSDGEPFRAISWINSYAIEYLLASFSHVFKLDLLRLYWSGKTLIAAFLIPLIWYSLFRTFDIKHKVSIVAIGSTLLVIFIMGDTFNSYGNWFLTRLFHGKVIVVSIGLPLIWFHLIRYLEKPNLFNWGAIFIVSSSMIGMSTMAGILIPATSLALVLAFCVVNRIKIWFDIARSIGLAFAFSYLIVATIYIRSQVNPVILQNDSIMNSGYPTDYLGQLSFVTNTGFPLSAFIVITFTVACVKFLSGYNRRFVIWWCIFYSVIFLTPLTSSILIEHITTSNTYWRLFHGYPIVLVVGLMATHVFTKISSSLKIKKICIVSLIGLALGFPHVLLILQVYFGWDRTSPTIVRAIHRISVGGYRISSVRMGDIKSVLPLLPEGPVLAGHPINSDITIFSGRHPVIYARMIETEYWFLTRGEKKRGERRYSAMRFASGDTSARAKTFFRVIDEEPKLKSILTNPIVLNEETVLKKLVARGFEDRGQLGRYRLFVRENS